MSRVPSPFPATKAIHHSKHHHSSSKHKHNNDHHKGHGHSHSHHHSHPHRMPSPSPISPYLITPSASFPPVQNPQFHFPTVPHRPAIKHSHSHGILRVPSPIQSPHVHFVVPPSPHHRPPNRSNSSNNLINATSTGHNHLIKPPPKHSTKPHTPAKRITKPIPTPHPDFQYSKCTGRRRALCVCFFLIFNSPKLTFDLLWWNAITIF